MGGMDLRRITLAYVVVYLAVGGLGFLVVPQLTLDLFQSNGDYSEEGFRVAGAFMLGLAYLISTIVRYEDWKYYPVSIVVRVGFVVFLTAMLLATGDPLFLVIDAIVLVGLVPSLYFIYRERTGGSAG